jgi:RNA polymerase sigma factor (sigma-70 family)
LEASTLTHAQRRGLFARRSPLLRFQDDENLVALTRKGHQHAFDSLVERYQSRLLGFCRQMLGSTEDAEDVLQEVFVAAYNAMVADERPIAVRPWLYRIARNRCLNHLRKPTADGQDTMDTHPHMNGVTTHERVQNREEFRNLLSDVGQLPETQRSALLLREIDAMSYEEIALAMDTTVPGVKSLLVRARIALAESSQARQLTCDEVRLELAEAAEGIAKVSGPARRHIKSCDPCHEFRAQLRSDTKAFAAIFPAGPLLIIKGALLAKLSGIFGGGGGGAAAGAGGGGGAAAGAGAGAGAGAAGAGAAGAAGAGAAGAGAAAAGSTAAIGGAAAAGGAAASGGAAVAGGAAAAIGTKAAAGLATAAILAGGAAEIQTVTDHHPATKQQQSKTRVVHKTPPATAAKADPTQAVTPPVAPTTTPPGATTSQPPTTVTVPPQTTEPTAAGSSVTGGTTATATGRHRKHKNAVANSDSQPKSPVQTGPVTTGVEPSTCDADGDGVADPGSPSGCGTSTGTVGTAVQQGTVSPTLYSAPKQHKAAPRKSKKKVSQRRK